RSRQACRGESVPSLAVSSDGTTLGERTLRPASASGSAETLPGSALGTPAYMSPEQATGDLEHLGPRSSGGPGSLRRRAPRLRYRTIRSKHAKLSVTAPS